MTSLFIYLFAGFLIGYKIGCRENVHNKITATMTGILVGLLMWVIVGVISSYICPHKSSFLEKEKIEIVASEDFDGTQGFLFFVPGKLDVKPYYRFYIKPFEEDKELKKISIEGVEIFREDRANAYLAKGYEIRKYPDWFYLMLFPKFILETNWEKIKIIHVPIGTMKTGNGFDVSSEPQK